MLFTIVKLYRSKTGMGKDLIEWVLMDLCRDHL